MLAVILFPFPGIYSIASNTKQLLFMMQYYVALRRSCCMFCRYMISLAKPLDFFCDSERGKSGFLTPPLYKTLIHSPSLPSVGQRIHIPFFVLFMLNDIKN